VGWNHLHDLDLVDVVMLNPYGYIAIGLAILALICWAIWRLDRSERGRQYWLAIEAETLRRENLRVERFKVAQLDRRD
jgi:uncharacterized protein YfaA (DUF2138 family)